VDKITEYERCANFSGRKPEIYVCVNKHRRGAASGKLKEEKASNGWKRDRRPSEYGKSV